MPKTLTAAEYKQKPKEELEQLQQEWQNRAEQGPISIGRGTWIATKGAAVGALATIPGAIAGGIYKARSMDKESFGLVFSDIKNTIKSAFGGKVKSAIPDFDPTTMKREDYEALIDAIENKFAKAEQTVAKNLTSESTKKFAAYAAIATGFVAAATAAYTMVKRRRKINSDRADIEVLKADSALQEKTLEEATDKAKHTAADLVSKLEKVQSAEKADHAKLTHAEKGEHEKPEHHEKKEHETDKKDHDTKAHGEDGITKDDMKLLNERLAAGKHGEAKEHTKEHEKKDIKSHADREEHGAGHHGR